MLRKWILYIISGVIFFILMSGVKEGFHSQYRKIENPVEIFIVRHTWHTGIIINTSSLNSECKLLVQTYPKAQHIEFGWGDYDFFRSDKATFGMAASAMLWPTSSVLHVMPYYRNPELYFDKERIFIVELSEYEFSNLLERVSYSFKSDENGNFIPLEAENPVGGRFYLSKEKYHLFKTCNVWTARVLDSGGYTVSSFMVFGPRGVMNQVRKIEKR